MTLMRFDDYEARAAETAIYPGSDVTESYLGLSYVAMGLSSEAGEVVGKVSKILRDNLGHITDEHRAMIEDEAGDVLWFLARVAAQIGSSLSDIAARNLGKLADRAERGVLRGSGDDR